jgi:DNA helicase TIP49 (TBP-interacting protein)
MLRNRYTLNRRLREDKDEFDGASDWKLAQPGIENSIKHKINLVNVYENVQSIKLENKIIGNDVNMAARLLVQSFYNCISSCY